MLPTRRALYAAFDRFPTRKGSGVHIARFSRALFDWAGGGVLYALGGSGVAAQLFGQPTYTSYGASRNNIDFLALMHFAAKSR